MDAAVRRPGGRVPTVGALGDAGAVTGILGGILGTRDLIIKIF